jgi:hypothetical protein
LAVATIAVVPPTASSRSPERCDSSFFIGDETNRPYPTRAAAVIVTVTPAISSPKLLTVTNIGDENIDKTESSLQQVSDKETCT